MSSAADSGKRHGAFRTYHPNGELESEGNYVNGLADGTFVRYASSAPGSQPLRSCCVPPGARELRTTYRGGELLREVFYDAEGRVLLSDGRPEPERPAGLPLEADFDEYEGRWVVRREARDALGLRRSFDLEGRLFEERDIVAGRTVALRSFGKGGKLRSERHFDDTGRFHGEYRLSYDGQAPYADAEIREERGSFEHGQSVGVVRYYDAGERELGSRERGAALSDEGVRALLVDEGLTESPEALLRRAGELAAEGRIREAFFTTARACGRAGQREPLERLLASAIVPLVPEVARARAAELESNADLGVRDAFDALLSGADPADVLRVLATLVPATTSAGPDLVEAALLLAPRPKARVTRALIRLEQGDPTGALADVAKLDPEYAPIVRHVSELARTVFRKPAFTPPREPPSEPEAELAEVSVGQPLAAIHRSIALYATRLGELRKEIRRRLGGAEPEWLPPELSHLEGVPLELRRYSATITDAGDREGDDDVKTDVEIDETLALTEASVKELMVVSRAEFDALCWLCWSAGLDDIRLPVTLTPRASFKAAVNDAIQRCFRAHDQIRTGGLLSKARGAPDFSWEGLAVGELSNPLAQVVAREYLERRALFFWLLFPENLSPFQSDLREA